MIKENNKKSPARHGTLTSSCPYGKGLQGIYVGFYGSKQ